MKYYKIDKEWAEGPFFVFGGVKLVWSQVIWVLVLIQFVWHPKTTFYFELFFRIKAYIWDIGWILVKTLRKVDRGDLRRFWVACMVEMFPLATTHLTHRFEVRAMFGRSPKKSPFLRPTLRSWISQTLKSAKWGHLGKSCGPPRKLILGQKLPLITLLERIFISGAV